MSHTWPLQFETEVMLVGHNQSSQGCKSCSVTGSIALDEPGLDPNALPERSLYSFSHLLLMLLMIEGSSNGRTNAWTATLWGSGIAASQRCSRFRHPKICDFQREPVAALIPCELQYRRCVPPLPGSEIKIRSPLHTLSLHTTISAAI